MTIQSNNKDSIGESGNALMSEISNSEDMTNLNINNLVDEISDKKINDKKGNLNINEIKNENAININSANSDENDENKIIEENRATTIIVNGESNQNENLENSIFNGIQKEGFDIDNNNLNIDGEKNKNEINTINLNKSK